VPRDRAVERKNGGVDTVVSTVDWTLGKNLERLNLRGPKAIVGIGNRLDNRIKGNARNNILQGGDGNDRLKGRKGDDELQGADHAAQSIGDIDTLVGGAGSDTFVLGNQTGCFYDDADSNSQGYGDYALIKRFNISADTLQIAGNWADYVLMDAPEGLPQGVAIYLDKPDGEPDELIAIVQGVSALELIRRYQPSSEPPDSVNVAPVARGDRYTTTEDTPLQIPVGTGVLENDSDANQDTLVVTAFDVISQQGGSVTVNANGSFRYVPPENFHGTDTYTYTIRDGKGGTDTATVTVVVNAVNDAPVAVDDIYVTRQSRPLTVAALAGLLINDSDVEGDTLSIADFDETSRESGTLSVNPDGSFTYTPPTDFVGTDSFTYTVTDGAGNTASATVTLGVLATVRVEAEDMDLEDYVVETGQAFASNNALIAVTPTEGVVGRAIASFDGFTSTYDIKVGYYDESDGVSQISVYISDILVDTWILNNSAGGVRANAGNFVSRTIATGYTVSTNDEIRIEGTTQSGERSRVDYIEFIPSGGSTGNSAPVAGDDRYTTNEDTVLTVPAAGVLGNDQDSDGDTLTITSFDATSSEDGTVVVNSDGSISYTPAADFNGTDSFTYTLSDGQGGTDVGTVTVTVSAVEDAPVAVKDSYSTEADTELTLSATLGLLANDRDADNDGLTVLNEPSTTSAGGDVAVSPDGSLTYTPPTGFEGVDTFDYTVSDGNGNTATATVEITVGNPSSTGGIVNLSGSIEEVSITSFWADNATTSSTFIYSDWWAKSSNKLQIFEEAQDIVLQADISISDPQNWDDLGNLGTILAGTEVDSYFIAFKNPSPGTNVTVQATITFDSPIIGFMGDPSLINPTNEVFVPYVARPLSGNGTLDMSANGLDTVEVLDNGYTLRVTMRNTSAVDPLRVLTDSGAPSNNVKPVARDESYTTDEDTVLAIAAPGLLNNDSDSDGDTLAVIAFDETSSAGGTVAVNVDGSFSYTPVANFNGTDTFTYTVSDGQGGITTATATMTVNPVEDIPSAVNDSYVAFENTPLVIDVANGVLSNDSDVDGDTLRITSFSTSSRQGGVVVLNANGGFSYIPPANYTGSDSFTYTMTDGNGNNASSMVNLTVSLPTVSYADAANGVIANLDTGRVLLPLFGTQEQPAIMPMGDSITAGVHTVEPYPGAYRIQLWDQFSQDDLTVDFVGSQSNGSENGLPDEAHEGYPSQRISFFTNLVNAGVFTTNPTDILLLMVGANDANADPALGVTDVVNSMFQRLGSLLQRIQALSPNTKVLLSSITPRDPLNTDAVKVQRVDEFNSRLPGFIDDQITRGRNVTFVDAGGSLAVSDLNSDGLHPSRDGYDKLGDAWYDALVEQEQVSGISNLVGSAFDDEMTGNGVANILDGGGGNDLIAGTTSVLAGANEQDVLIGGAGGDRFILGDASQPYYTANGDDDYVVIQDFDASEDVVQVHGVASDYVQQQVGGDRYLRLADSNELVAIFKNTSGFNLLDANFTFK
jgi:lysophospholipase L1-like esterase